MCRRVATPDGSAPDVCEVRWTGRSVRFLAAGSGWLGWSAVTSPSPSGSARRDVVTALLVSHDGARWLPAVLDGMAAQTRAPDRVVAVDTGSQDDSPRLVRERLGAEVLVEAPATSSWGSAVTAGLSSLPDDASPDAPEEWVWLLHDDSAPAPDALERLLAAAEADPGAAILGPKLREWPSLRRLLEVGVTISGTGRRETGLERGEYDQGQHDRVRDVLAVNTAGMLVRRSVLVELGFDDRLPVHGTDIDLGWRAARAGHRSVVVPDAVVFHAEAAHRGVRPHPVGGRHHRRAERSAALYTLLVNGSLPSLPFRLVRLLLGSLLRVLGLLLVRAPVEAGDELLALVGTYLRPWRIVAGRLARRRTARVSSREVRPLLAAPWVPYRHGLDLVTDVTSALVLQAGDVNAARKQRRLAGAETGPVADEAENLPEDTGLVARLVRSPVAWTFTLLVVLAVLAFRGLYGTGLLTGGALLPAPASALDWWRTYLSSHHDIGAGSSAPAAPYLLPLAVLGTVLLGKAWLVVDLVFLLAVPLAAWGAFRFLRQVTGSRPMSLWGAVAYGVLPVVTGAVPQGRLGTVAAALLLPWLAHAAVFLREGETPDRRRRAAWRTTLLLALVAAFVPLAWVLALLVAVAALAARVRSRGSAGSLALLVAVPLVGSAVLLLPWTVATWAHRGVGSLLLEAGLPAPRLAEQLTRWDALTGRPGDGAPAWIGVGLLLAALAALARPDTRPQVLRAWTVLVLALVVTAGLAPVSIVPAGGTVDQPLYLGFPLLVAQAAGVTAAALAGTGIRRRLAGTSFGWRQPAGVAVVAVAAVTPLVSAAWWLWHGSADPLDRGRATTIPTYMTDALADDPDRGVLVVRGTATTGFAFQVLHGPGLRLGDDSVLPTTAEQAGLGRLVENLATAPEAADVSALAHRGVGFVYAPAPADVGLVGNLDSVSGVTTGSATVPGARAWQLQPPASRAGLDEATDPARPWLLAVQGAALVLVAVLAAPTRKAPR